jgi:hypothetical protein
MIRRIFLTSLIILLFASITIGASIDLKATWTPNMESDMAGYNIYRTDGARTKINLSLIPHPPQLPYFFTTIAPDNQDYTLIFVLTAVDVTGNESGDSLPAPFVSNRKPPDAPIGFGVSQ